MNFLFLVNFIFSILAKLFFFGVISQTLIPQNGFAQSKYDENWVFRAELKEGYSLFTVILQKDSLQRYTKGYIYSSQKKIPFDSICPTKQGMDLYFRDVFGMNAIFSCNFAITSDKISGIWTRYHFFEKITSNIYGSLESYGNYNNYLENSKRYYNNDFLKGSWQIFFEDDTKGTLIFDNYEVNNIIIVKINTPFLNFQYLEGYYFLNNIKDRQEEGHLYLFGFDGEEAITIRGKPDSTKNNISGVFISTNKKLNFTAKRNL